MQSRQPESESKNQAALESDLAQDDFVSIQFYATATYACSYLPNLQARSQVATPTNLINTERYSKLVQSGFRRSGVFVYRPYCDQCQACIPVRTAVADFVPNRSQRRALKQHSNLVAQQVPLEFSAEHFKLYQGYQNQRHAGGGMDQDDHDQYAQFLLQSRVETRMVEFRDPDHILRMVSIIDVLQDGLSSVYTFYDSSDPKTAYGTYNVLWQITQTLALNLPYLYLGYWIEASRKMSYKTQFKPIQALIKSVWTEI